MTAIPYTVRRSDRARHARILVDLDGVEVVLPRRMSLRHVEPFVAEKREWIERTLRRMEAAAADAPVVRLGDGGEVPYLGERLGLRVRVEPGRARAHVARRGDGLRVAVGAPGREPVRAALERWYRRAARAEVARRLDAVAPGRWTSLSIRRQRTRWASCSQDGAMSFNWRLLLAPAEILDYVVWHEACHLDRLDHSPRFWALVEAGCPGYRERERWLRLHGGRLRL